MATVDPNPALAEILRMRRHELRITRATLEAATGLSSASVIRYLNNERPLTVANFAALCHALSLDPVEVLSRAVTAAPR